jgi:hypothetical protein
MDLTAFDLTIWVPAVFVLGLATLTVLTAFVSACDRV